LLVSDVDLQIEHSILQGNYTPNTDNTVEQCEFPFFDKHDGMDFLIFYIISSSIFFVTFHFL